MRGRQYISPNGYASLDKNLTYYLLCNHTKLKATRLVCFIKDRSEWRTLLVGIKRDEFEYGLLTREIVPAPCQNELPPFLSTNEDSISSIGMLQESSVKKESYIDRRLSTIAPLVEKLDEILGVDDPDKYINEWLKKNNPGQNQVRVRLWFYAYILHGNNYLALSPAFSKCGRWDRKSRDSSLKKSGPRTKSGGTTGFRMDELSRSMIVQGFDKYASRNRTLRNAYALTLQHFFKCTVTGKIGKRTIVHKNGAAFPTYRQFRYHIGCVYTQEEVDIRLLGQERVRHKLKANLGRFSESVTNLMERVEADAYVVQARPRGMAIGVYRASLFVVTAVCVTSSLIVGIGMSIGSETANAYRMCLFSMAIGKKKFVELFGIDADLIDWPCEGLPGEFIVDRGVGSVIKSGVWADTMTPSYDGQGKATVEGSHRKTKKKDGQPEFLVSTLTTVEMARTEIEAAIKKNHTANVGDRRTPEMIANGVGASPIDIWKYLDSLARNNAQPMSFDVAVRTYLRKIEAIVRNDGVWLNEQRYDSPDLRATGLYEVATRKQRFSVDVYVLSLCVRHIWIEVKGRIYELEMRLPMNDDYRQTELSLVDTVELHQLKNKTNREHREHGFAENLAFNEKMEVEYGVTHTTVTPKVGRGSRKTDDKLERALEKKGSSLM